MTEPLRVSVEVRCPADHAFGTWTTKLSRWWPADHTVSGAPAAIVLEGRIGGRIYERTPAGVEHDWGLITAWDPPRRLGYQWFLRQDRADATDVRVTFVAVEPGLTRIDIEHTGWERLGARGSELRQRNHLGWSGLLPHLVAAAGQE